MVTGLDGEEADLSNLMCDEADFLTPIKSPVGGSAGGRRMFQWHDDVGEQMAADLRRTHSADASLLGTEPCSVSSIGAAAAFLHPHSHHDAHMGISLPAHISAFSLMADMGEPEPLSALQAAFQLQGTTFGDPDAMLGSMQDNTHTVQHQQHQQPHSHGVQPQQQDGPHAVGNNGPHADMHSSQPSNTYALDCTQEAAHQELLLCSRLSIGSARFGSENDLRQLVTPGGEHDAGHPAHACPPLHMLATVEDFNVQLSRVSTELGGIKEIDGTAHSPQQPRGRHQLLVKKGGGLNSHSMPSCWSC
jgi:hypothetical protein